MCASSQWCEQNPHPVFASLIGFSCPPSGCGLTAWPTETKGLMRGVETRNAHRRPWYFGFVEDSKPPGGAVRISTVFNKLLSLQGAWVRAVQFTAEAVVVTVSTEAQTQVRALRFLDESGVRSARWDLAAYRARQVAGAAPGDGASFGVSDPRRGDRGGALGGAGSTIHAGLRGPDGVADEGDEQDRGDEAVAHHLADGRPHHRARRRAQA